jgi:hypothetical protein
MDDEQIGPDLSPPEAIIRLASAQHRFRCPDMAKGQSVSFVRSFKTSGSHPKTKQATSKVGYERIGFKVTTQQNAATFYGPPALL